MARIIMSKKRKASGGPSEGSEKEPLSNLNCQIPVSLRKRLDAVEERSGLHVRVIVIKALTAWLTQAEKQMEEKGPDSLLF